MRGCGAGLPRPVMAAPKRGGFLRALVEIEVLPAHWMHLSFGGFHQWGYPRAGWFIRENPIKIADFGVPPFMDTSIYFQIHCA